MPSTANLFPRYGQGVMSTLIRRLEDPQGSLIAQEAIVRGIHMVKLPVSPGVGH